MIKMFCRLLLGISIVLLAAGCANVGFQTGEKIMTPENRLIPVAGTWKVEKLLVLPGRVLPKREINRWLGTTAVFDNHAAVFGKESCLDPKYKIKRVNTQQYLAYNYKIKPQDLGFQAETVEVISITSMGYHFYDLIKLDQNRLVLYKNEVFYFLQYLNNKGTQAEQANSEDQLLRSGIALGLRSANRQKDYRTLWITARNRELKSVVTLPELIVPRKSGFWVLGVEHQPSRDTLFAHPFPNNPESVNKAENQQVITECQRQAIVFAGNDYVATAYSDTAGGKTPEFPHLRVLPIDNLTGNLSGVSISDVVGEAGRKAMLSSAAQCELFMRKRNLTQLEGMPQETNFTLVRRNGHWIMQGRLNVQDSMAKRDFVDFNINMLPPPELVNYDELCIPWQTVKETVPSAIDAFTSPNRDIALIIDKDAIYIYPIRGELLENRLLQKIPLQQGEAVVMAEWATGPYVERWTEALSAQGR